MNLRDPRGYPLPKPFRRVFRGNGDVTISRLIGNAILVLVGGSLIGSIVWQPTKRNIEVLAGLIFLGIVLVADPFRALLFTIVVVPFPAYTSVGTTSMLLVYALVGLIVMKSKQLRLPSPFLRRDLDLAIMGFILMMAVSFYNQPQAAMREARTLFLGMISGIMLFYVLIYLIVDTRRFWRLVIVMQSVTLLLSLLGLYQYFFPDKQLLPEFFSFSRKVAEMEEIRRGQVRVAATFAGQELFAEYLGMCSMFQFFLFRRATTIHARSFWAISQALLLGALFATATRGALIIVVVGYGYLFLIGSKVVPRRQLLTLVFVACALFYLGMGFFGDLVDFMFERMSSIGADDGSIQNRSVVLQQAFHAIGDQPFLGHGLGIPAGTFRGYVTRNIHNLYVTLAYMIGLPGLAAFVWIVTSILRLTWKGVHDLQLPRHLREINLLMNSVVVMFLIDEIKIEFTRQVLTVQISWIMLGLAVVAWKLSYRSRQRVSAYSS